MEQNQIYGEEMKMPDIKALAAILEGNTVAEDKQAVTMFMAYVDEMDNSFHMLMDELADMKKQLRELKESSMPQESRSVLNELHKELSDEVRTEYGRFQDMVSKVNEKAGELVRQFRENGILALDRVCKTLGLKNFYHGMKESLGSFAEKMEQHVQKLDTIEDELKKTALHLTNAGRAMNGKELKEDVSDRENAVFHALKAPYAKMGRTGRRMERYNAKAVSVFEKLEGRAAAVRQEREKPKPARSSIKEKLAVFKEKAQNPDAAKEQDNKKEIAI